MTATSSPAKKAKDGAKKKATKPTHPPTLEMITKAISIEKDPKGTSVMAIKKHILAHNQIKSAQLLNHMLRRAFEAGLAAGKLTRPKGQTEASLLAGRYRLASVKEKKPKAPAAAKPKKVVKKVTKSPKKAKTPTKKAATKKPKAKSPKKPVAKKAKTPKKPAAKKTAKKSPVKKAAPKKKTPKKTAKK